MGSSAWTKKGKNPFDYLQSVNHETAATSATVDNAPVYYARMIMAYVAVDRRDRVFVAGTPHVDLLAKLYTYQDMTDGSSTRGSFSPSSSTRNFDAVHTTSWAVLAMYNFGLSTEERFLLAETWLASSRASRTAGSPRRPARARTASTRRSPSRRSASGPAACRWDAAAARQFLKDNQNADGGFPVSPGGRTDAEATSAAIQAILALGEHPDDAVLERSASTRRSTPSASSSRPTARTRLTSRERLRPLAVTSWALTAHAAQELHHVSPGTSASAETAFRFRPEFRTVSPKNGAKFKSHVVLIRATYTDFYPKGTGIRPSACRLYVDNENKSRPADIGKYGLHLQLKNVPNGDAHLQDRAARPRRQRQGRSSASSPSPCPTPVAHAHARPRGPPTTPALSTRPCTPRPTPRPYTTPTPDARRRTTTVTPYPYYSPSPGGEPRGHRLAAPVAQRVGEPGGRGRTAAEVVPPASWVVPCSPCFPSAPSSRTCSCTAARRLLGAASQGTVLAGGGSAWERFKQTLARSKDLTRPSSRE